MTQKRGLGGSRVPARLAESGVAVGEAVEPAAAMQNVGVSMLPLGDGRVGQVARGPAC